MNNGFDDLYERSGVGRLFFTKESKIVMVTDDRPDSRDALRAGGAKRLALPLKCGDRDSLCPFKAPARTLVHPSQSLNRRECDHSDNDQAIHGFQFSEVRFC
jgi:hypothetical protein